MKALIASRFSGVEGLVGVATGGIAMGAIVAHELGLPFAYVRPKPKDHGLGKQIEGYVAPGQRVVVVEDLISTGGSSLSAVRALREEGLEVVGMVAIFTYAFPQAAEAFAQAGVELHTLASYPALLARLKATGQLDEREVELLSDWRERPETWGRD